MTNPRSFRPIWIVLLMTLAVLPAEPATAQATPDPQTDVDAKDSSIEETAPIITDSEVESLIAGRMRTAGHHHCRDQRPSLPGP